MQSPLRDRRRLAVVALCLTLVICACPACAVEAEYWITGNASWYHASYALENSSEYAWWDIGLLGERIPLEVENITLLKRNGMEEMIPFTVIPPNRITFEAGDYQLSFDGVIRNNHLLVQFDTPSSVSVHIPEGLDVRNPLLGAVSPGATITEEGRGILIQWNETRMIECRFYDPFRETLLTTFLTFWGVVAIVLLLPFLMRRRNREE
ncbi:MAG: DUF5803 family protein [Methanomicrobiales archaeon]|nr:DUF5803 family protein [Methanomicrobiales archaeon]